MQHLLTLLDYSYSILFIAPPGWGKTRMLLELIEKSDKRWIFISPLRALANEFYEATRINIKKTYLIQSKRDYFKFVKANQQFKLLIVTPEVFEYREFSETIFVWDEFHLNYYWGDTFRDSLQQLYYEVANSKVPLLQLTATMSHDNLKRWSLENALNYDHQLCINIANQNLKNVPKHIFYYPKFLKKLLMKNLELDLKVNKEGVTLLFCKYRQQVNSLSSYFKSKGVLVLTCMGGTTNDFGERLLNMPNVQLIIATTAISHGVNLPPVHRVYFSYPVRNRDFWIQMVGRGGRRGESYMVHTMDFEKECKSKFFSVFKMLSFFLVKYFLIVKRLC